MGKLRDIGLGDNKFSAQLFPLFVYNLQYLEQIRFQNSNFNGQLSRSIGFLAHLEIIHLHGNSLTGEIPSEIESLINLQELYLHSNGFEGDIPESIGNLKNLGTFDRNGAVTSFFMLYI